MTPATRSLDHMLSDEHKEVRRTCEKFALKEIAPFAYEWEEAEEFPRELYLKAAEAGVLGISFPEAVGGAGGDALHAMMVTEGLMHGGSSGVIAGLGSLGIGLPPIVQAGDAAQIDRFVRPTIKGETISALAITEPGTGSDVAAVRTTARRDGDDYLIDGSKLFITSGIRADYVTVLCRTGEDAHGGLTFFVVEKGMPGYDASRRLKKTGWRASDTAEMTFESVRVPVANRVGPEGSAFVTLMRNFQGERLMLAAMGHAAAELSLAKATEWSKERQAFGRPIGSFQAIRHKFAEMATKIEAAKQLTFATAWRFANDEYPVREITAAKLFSSRIACEVADECIQIHGGYGYMREYEVERAYRDLRLNRIGAGTDEIMLDVIGRSYGI